MKICTVCHAESPEHARFCGFCGTRFTVPQKKNCPSCRAALAEDANFCTNCGYSFIPQAVLAVQPVIDRQIIEIEQPMGGVKDRSSVIIEKVIDYFRQYPLRSLAILAFILLIPLCCVINAAFAIRDRMRGAEAPYEGAMSIAIPSINPANTALGMQTETPAPTLTAVPLTPTATLMNTATPAQFLVKTGFSGCPPLHTKQEAGRVEKVIDGDTIDVILDGETVRVRYLGVDAAEMDPAESSQSFGLEAYKKNKELVEGQDVTLVTDVSDVDMDKRLLRYVFVGDSFVNHELVRAGYAKIFPSPPDAACDDYFFAAQQAASQDALGLWGVSLTNIPATQPALRMVQPVQTMVQPNQAASGDVVCNCSGPDLDCPDFQTGSQAQSCFDLCKPQFGDIFRLDRDQDGLACETQ